MLINIVGKNLDITDAMRERTEKKLSVLNKYFADSDNEEGLLRAKLLVKTYSDHQKVEVTVNTPIGLLRSEVKAIDFYAALDLSIDKLEDQIRRQKTRMSRKNREKLSVAFLEEMNQMEQEQQEEVTPVRTKEIFAQKMDLNDAVVQMEMLNHTFFIYTDSETNDIAVVYKRYDGGYGLLEVEKDTSV